MLKFLRKKGFSKKVLWFTAIIIILSFGVFGTAYLINDLGQKNYAGKINGRKISLQEFNNAYRQVIVESIIRYGDNFQNVQQYLDLESLAWERLILLNEIKRLRLKAKNEEVIQTIEQYKFFQRAGQFDSLLYNDVLNYIFKMTPREFEDGVRENVTFAKLFQEISSEITVSDQEVVDAYKRQNERAQISYVHITPEQFLSTVTVTDDEINQYYTTHKEEFQTPLSIAVEYLQFPVPTNTDQNSNTETEIQTKANEIVKQLVQNPDMPTIAASQNIEVKTTNYFSMEKPDLSLGWPYDVLNQLFKLGNGEISGPHRTDTGFVVIKIKDRRSSLIPELADVRDEIRQTVSLQKARDVARQKAEENLETIQNSWNQSNLKDFAEIVRTLGLEISQTPFFSQGQYLPKIGISKDFQETAFELTEQNPLSGIVSVGNGFAILHLDNKHPAEMTDLEKQRETIAENLLKEKRNQIFADYLADLRNKSSLKSFLPERKLQ